MNSIWLLMGLLLLSYIGSFLVGDRSIRGVGLPSGAEYVVLGFALGPQALGLMERSTVELFSPIAEVTVGWLVFVLGLNYGLTEGRRVSTARMLGGTLMALVTGAAVGAAAWFFLATFTDMSAKDRLVAATGAGAVCCETTRYAVRWVVERYAAKGPLSELIADLADSDDLAPLLAVAVVFALRPATGLATPVAVPPAGMAVANLLLGFLLGAIAALLLGRQFQIAEAWGVLLGMSMLLIGTADRLGLSSIAAMFAMGIAISALSRHRAEIHAMVMPTERAVMLPSLLLAGANVDFLAPKYLPWFVAACVAARAASKLLIGGGLFAASKPARAAGARLGVGLLSAGA
ncbi:MAG TPA: potassium transporter Kef, partial [Minicystis sp.]|nr:potassium transporter Kef [Minicystis sp.]